MNRKDFLKIITGVGAALPFLSLTRKKINNPFDPIEPVSIATWRFGMDTTAKAMDLLENGSSAMDATGALL